ncbi:MAG: hypothetical protein IAE79_08570 [Anaerolinea sp.]|nr:hypothetical protein [Anaerolinea sp.]
MSHSTSSTVPFMNNDVTSQEATPGGDGEARWEIVSRTAGLMPAQIQAGRLQAEGIPARAWQEAAGQAFGLMVGLLGTGYVAVPSEFAARALSILAEFAEATDQQDDDSLLWDDDDDPEQE